MKSIKKNLLVIGVIFSVSLVLIAFAPNQQKPWVVPAKYKSMKNPTKPNTADNAVGNWTIARV